MAAARNQKPDSRELYARQRLKNSPLKLNGKNASTFPESNTRRTQAGPDAKQKLRETD
jgi:hypothetical protein